MTDRCHWCQQFVSERTGKATVRNPDTLYCKPCFQKGVEMENEAMGLNDPEWYCLQGRGDGLGGGDYG